MIAALPKPLVQPGVIEASWANSESRWNGYVRKSGVPVLGFPKRSEAPPDTEIIFYVTRLTYRAPIPAGAFVVITAANPTLAPAVSAWSNAVTYALRQYVTSGGSQFRSLKAGNLNHATPVLPATANEWWQLDSSFPGSRSEYQPFFLSAIPAHWFTFAEEKAAEETHLAGFGEAFYTSAHIAAVDTQGNEYGGVKGGFGDLLVAQLTTSVGTEDFIELFVPLSTWNRGNEEAFNIDFYGLAAQGVSADVLLHSFDVAEVDTFAAGSQAEGELSDVIKESAPLGGFFSVDLSVWPSGLTGLPGEAFEQVKRSGIAGYAGAEKLVDILSHGRQGEEALTHATTGTGKGHSEVAPYFNLTSNTLTTPAASHTLVISPDNETIGVGGQRIDITLTIPEDVVAAARQYAALAVGGGELFDFWRWARRDFATTGDLPALLTSASWNTILQQAFYEGDGIHPILTAPTLFDLRLAFQVLGSTEPHGQLWNGNYNDAVVEAFVLRQGAEAAKGDLYEGGVKVGHNVPFEFGSATPGIEMIFPRFTIHEAETGILPLPALDLNPQETARFHSLTFSWQVHATLYLPPPAPIVVPPEVEETEPPPLEHAPATTVGTGSGGVTLI